MQSDFQKQLEYAESLCQEAIENLRIVENIYSDYSRNAARAMASMKEALIMVNEDLSEIFEVEYCGETGRRILICDCNDCADIRESSRAEEERDRKYCDQIEMWEDAQ